MLTRKRPIIAAAFALAILAIPALSQDTGWRKFDQSASAETTSPLPEQLTLPAGTWLTVRIEQELSSDHNLKGDSFTASLVQPLVASGLLVARRGQMVGGQVVEAEKAGRSKGTSRLGVMLTELGLVDGRQVPIRTRFTEYQGTTSAGSDVATVATTTGVGAAIGAAADGGFGAGMGAIAGAAAGMIGVLATRGKPTVIYPEAVLTFRLEEALTISTEESARAFRAVAPEDYAQQTTSLNRPRGASPPHPYYYGGWSYWYDPFYYPRFYGPSLHFYSGPRFYGGGYRRGRR